MRMACDILLQSSHLSPISILPTGSADIIQRTIRAAVQQHFFDLKTSIDQQDINYDQGAGPSNPADPCCHGDEEQQTDPEDSPCSSDQETPRIHTEQHPEHSQQHTQDAEEDSGAALEDGSGMDLDTEALVDAENNINTARQDSQACHHMEQTDIISCDPSSCQCDQNANTSENNRNHMSPCQQNTGHAPHLQLFPDHQWEASPPSPHVPLPPIDFSCMHLQRGGQDPVPAYKSWHDDSDSGEAQLSPLAGRMVPLPLLPHEEGEAGEGGDDSSPSSSRSHHHLARRFLDFGAHGAQRFLQQDPEATSPTKALRPRRASIGSKEATRGGDTVSHQLNKKLQHLKKKIKQFEEQFEKERNYKPSHGDKAANPKVLKWMTDLTKIRKQIKDARHRAESELGPHTRPRSNTLPKSFGSTLDHTTHDAPGEGRAQRPSREDTLDLIQRRVRGKRQEDGWPDDIKKMTKEQLSCEKTVLQKNLLHYEGLHGRPASPSSKRRNQTLQPIIEGETSHFCDEIQEEEEEEVKKGGIEEERIEEEEEEEEEEGESSGGELQGPEVIMALDPSNGGPMRNQNQPDGQSECPMRTKNQQDGSMRAKLEEGSGKLALDLRLSSSNASSMPELLEQLWKSRAEKKKLRKNIREFEEDFYQHNGRNVQKEDRVPMLEEYREYKRIKAKLRLLEVLISKQDSSKSI